MMEKVTIVRPGHMITFSGILFDLMDPNPDLIRIEDIAHGLAYNCRWNGATKRFCSVAEHSMRVAHACGPDRNAQLAGLLHDAEEAYWGDMISPLKSLLRNFPEGRKITNKMVDLRLMIFAKFLVPYIDVRDRDEADLIMEYENCILADRLLTLPPSRAERLFLKYFNELKS